MSEADTVEKRKLFARNTLLGVLSWLVPIIPTFIATPIVFDRLGAAEYGLLVTLVGFISYFFTTAIGKVAAKYVAEYRASGDHELIAPIISATLFLGVGITSLGVVGTVLFARPLMADALRVPPDLQDASVAGLYIACGTILLVVTAQIFQMVLQGLQRFDKYFLLANLSSMSFSLGGIVLVLLGYGLFGLLWWNLATWAVTLVASYLLARKLLPGSILTLSIPVKVRRNVLRYALSIAAFQVFGNVLLLFERSWVTRRFGLEAVSYYAVAMTLAMLLHLFVSSLVLAMFPVVNELLRDRGKLRSLYRRATKVVLAFAGLALAGSVAGGREFLAVWMTPEFADRAYVLLIIHTITFAILAVSTISWQLAEGFEQPGLNAASTFVWMAVGIAAMVLLPAELGPAGTAIARLIGVLVFVPAILYAESRFLDGIFTREWLLDLAVVGLATALAAGAIAGILYALPIGWMSIVAAGIAGTAMYAAVVAVCGYFDHVEKAMFRSMLGRSR